jgi:multiphosphoryl transfer protein
MAPMISSLEEVLAFKAAIASAKRELMREGVSFSRDVKIGIMIEVPSVAFLVSELCREVDFFSLGTNDLCQYFFAADRGNSKASPLFTVQHPAFLRLLDQIVSQIHKENRWVGICGEMAADLRNLPLLLGLGLDEISVPASEVGDLRRAISKWNSDQCRQILEHALACRNTGEVTKLLPEQVHSVSPEPLLTNELIVLGSASETKEEVIQEMIDAFYLCGRTEDRQALEEALWAREAIGSTELGHGFAIPHCKTDAVTANSICVLRLREQILWDSEHSEPVSMIVLLAVRDSDSENTHMQVFSSLARKLINDDFRQHLMKMATAEEITAYLAHQLKIPPRAEHSTVVEPPAQTRTW